MDINKEKVVFKIKKIRRKMKKESALAKRHNEMIEFIKYNAVVKNIDFENDMFEIIDYQKNQFQITGISKTHKLKKLIDFNYQYDSKILDNDKEELKLMLEKVINHIIKINEDENQIPGFIFLQSKTDFKQTSLNERVDKIINQQGFNKQKLGTTYFSKPFYDLRNLSQAELILWTLSQQTIGENRAKPRYIKYKGFYLPELTHYNPNKQIMEVSNYKHVFSPEEYKNIKKCVVCKEPSGIDHSKCKKENEYKKYIIKRNNSRYLKHIFINKQRKEKIKGSKSAESGIRFKKAEVNRSFLEKYGSKELKQEKYYISLIK